MGDVRQVDDGLCEMGDVRWVICGCWMMGDGTCRFSVGMHLGCGDGGCAFVMLR